MNISEGNNKRVLINKGMEIDMLILAFLQCFGKFHLTISSLKFIKKRSSLNFIVYTFFQFRNDNTVFCWGPHIKNQPVRFSMRNSCWPIQNFIPLYILGLLVNLKDETKQYYILSVKKLFQ